MIDSKVLLDVTSRVRHDSGMSAHCYYVHIERIDATSNMARYYAMSLDRSLFGHTALTRRWGRIGTAGKFKVHYFDDDTQAVLLFLELLRRKRRHGYKPR